MGRRERGHRAPQATGHGAYRPLDHGMLLTTKRLDHLRVNAEAHTRTMGAGLAWSRSCRRSMLRDSVR